MSRSLPGLSWSRDGKKVGVYGPSGLVGKLEGRAVILLDGLLTDFFQMLAEVNLDEIEQPEVDGGAGEADGERDALSGEPV